MTQAIFLKRGRTLVAVDDEGLALLATMQDGKEVSADVKHARNPRHHRLFFAVLKFCVEHACNPETGEMLFTSIEQAKTAIKIATGEVDPFVDPHSGKTFFTLRSISYASMDQSRFSAFYERAVYVIAERWMPAGTTPADVRAEIEAMIEPNGMSAPAPRQQRSRVMEPAE